MDLLADCQVENEQGEERGDIDQVADPGGGIRELQRREPEYESDAQLEKPNVDQGRPGSRVLTSTQVGMARRWPILSWAMRMTNSSRVEMATALSSRV